jgi:hypothetical protein
VNRDICHTIGKIRNLAPRRNGVSAAASMSSGEKNDTVARRTLPHLASQETNDVGICTEENSGCPTCEVDKD